MLKCPIDGCFFHMSQAVKRQIDKRGMRKSYDSSEKFRRFCQELSAVAHSPLALLDDALRKLEEKYLAIFENDPTLTEQVKELLQYFKSFWMDGPFLPSLWNCFERRDDLTNNNQ